MATLNPRCVGTTGNTFSQPTIEAGHGSTGFKRRKIGHRYEAEPNYFSNAQFSNDGTTIITQTANHSLRTFILHPNLLDESKEPHDLKSYVTFRSSTPIQSFSIYPHYNLQTPSTTLTLSSSNDLPISLNNTLQEDYMQAQYFFIHPATEAYISSSSLLWTPRGTHFLAGRANQIALFDVSYPSSAPIVTRKTARGKRETRAQGSMRGCKGVVTALSINCDSVLAAGTRERNIALYGLELGEECMTSFSLASSPGNLSPFKGTGVSQLAWSPNGTYLLIAERQSDVVQVFDLRNTNQRVSWLSGREADTPQKLGIDVVPTADGYEVWGGGTDGCVRMWKNPGSVEGEHEPEGFMKGHEDAVSAAIWHPSGAVLATCSGQKPRRRHTLQLTDSSDDSSSSEDELHREDSSLKIWTL